MSRFTPHALLLPLFTISAAAFLAGCATPPAAKPTATKVASSASKTPKTCTTDYATGSHITTNTVCMTDEEREQSEQQTDQSMATYRALSAHGPAGH